MGAWYVTVGNYMSAVGMSAYIHWAYTVVPLSAIVSPYFLGLVVDRYFSTEKVLGVLLYYEDQEHVEATGTS